MKVKINDLADAVVKSLSEYSDGVGEAVSEAVEKVTNSTLKEVRSTSPILTGDYRKGWRSRVVTSAKGRHVKEIYNKTDYQLTHLLEKGHKNISGGQVAAIPHIKPAEEKAAKELEDLIKEAIK